MRAFATYEYEVGGSLSIICLLSVLTGLGFTTILHNGIQRTGVEYIDCIGMKSLTCQ